MNHIPNINKLKNQYFAMRHGTSTANEADIIVSNPNNGTCGYGLSKKGRAEAQTTADYAKEKLLLDSETVIIASDFMRARETAEILSKTLGVYIMTTTPKLRERFFGLLDGKKGENYNGIYNNDSKDIANTQNDVESVENVIVRVTALVNEMEKRYSGKNIVLVSHGDTLQILQSILTNSNPAKHYEMSFAPAEIRKLNHHS